MIIISLSLYYHTLGDSNDNHTDNGNDNDSDDNDDNDEQYQSENIIQ